MDHPQRHLFQEPQRITPHGGVGAKVTLYLQKHRGKRNYVLTNP